MAKTIGSLYGFYLSRLVDVSALHPVLTSLTGVLGTIDQRISAMEADLKKAEDDLEYLGLDSMIMDQGAFYHEMLGIAFVAAQVEITRALAEIKNIHDWAKRKRTKLITTSMGNKREIMRFGFKGSAMPSPVEVINAAANYHKHSDEWPRKWDVNLPKNPNSVNTIKILAALQIQSDDFVVAAGGEHIGIKLSSDLLGLLDVLSSWRLGLALAYKAELVKKGVHPADGAP